MAPSVSEKDSTQPALFDETRSSKSHLHSNDENILYSTKTIFKAPFFTFLDRSTTALLIMVAVPTYLLVSAAASSISNFYHHENQRPLRAQTPTIPLKTTDQFASIRGPVLKENFPDPAIIVVDGVLYAFATNNRGVGGTMIHVQVATSTDNSTWDIMPGMDALPNVGFWETGARVWAPDVVQLDDGTFVLYYADEPIWSPSHHCVGAATSKNVTGPYIPQSYPFACPDLQTFGGAIDPDGFLDADGRRYVTYKVDGNSIGHGGSCVNGVEPLIPTPILLQEVERGDGITPIGVPVQILDRDIYDGPLIEAPSLHRSHEGVYFLFFSSNCFTGPLYDTSYATATNIAGPYTKTDRPLYMTGDGPDLFGPGGTDVLSGGEMIVFHGHLHQHSDKGDGGNHHRKPGLSFVRGMYTARPRFRGTSVSLA